MRICDLVPVGERGLLRLRSRLGEVIAGRSFEDISSVVEVKGWVSLVLRERGKIVPGSRREGKNVFTNTGKEFYAQVSSLQPADAQHAEAYPLRGDSVAFIGVGVGSQLENVNVYRLVSPAAFSGDLFLAPLELPTWPLHPTRTTVSYKRTFGENEITAPGSSQVDVSEIGLFTNGSPSNGYTPWTRDTTLANAEFQAPVTYKTVEPVGKTNALELDIVWELRL